MGWGNGLQNGGGGADVKFYPCKNKGGGANYITAMLKVCVWGGGGGTHSFEVVNTGA